MLCGAIAIATILGACSSDVSQLEDTGDCPGCNLNRTSLRGERFAAADLTEANFHNADLRAIDLREAVLRRAQLAGADLSDADLAGADLSGANLENADLRGADLRRANLSRAALAGADLRNINWGERDFERAIADEIPFLAEILREAILQESEIEQSELYDAELGISLEDVDFRNGDFAKILAVSALIHGTTFAESELQAAIAPVPLFENATYDRSTRFPPDFDPEAADMRLID